MWATALILGLAGSLHCAGMCSPLVMAVTSVNAAARWKTLLYNSGRIFTYALLGLLVTAFGVLIDFSGFQFVLTLSIAVVFILMGLSGIGGLKIPVLTSALLKFSTQLKNVFSSVLKKKSPAALFTMGMLNGLLPCGLTYFALTYCLTLARPVDGFQFMLLFGAGTLPVMLGFTTMLKYVVNRFKINLMNITRYSYIVVGVIVLARLYFSQHELIHHTANQLIIICTN